MASDVVVIGAGTIGSVFSTLLYDKGYNVAVVDLESRLEDIKKNGIKIKGNKDLDVNVSENFSTYTSDQIEDIKLKKSGIIILGVKTPYLDKVVDYLPRLKSKNPVFMFQNGLYPEVMVKDLLAGKGHKNISNNIVGGVLMGSGSFEKDFIKYNFYDLKIGCWEKSKNYDKNVKRVSKFLSGLDFDVESYDSKEYREKRFEKATYNLVNSLTAFFGLDNVIDVVKNDYLKYAIEKKIEESKKIAELEGLNLEDIMEKSMVVFTEKVPYHPTTMRQDFEKSPIVTEIDHLDLAFYRLGLQHDFVAEYNQLFGELVSNFSRVFNEFYKADKTKALKFKEEAIQGHKDLLESGSLEEIENNLEQLRNLLDC